MSRTPLGSDGSRRGGFLPWRRQLDELRKIRALTGVPAAGEHAARSLAAGDDDAPCTVCETATRGCCSACRAASYCSEAHRERDERWHAPVCAALREIGEDDALRRELTLDGLVAELAGRPHGARVPASWDEYLDAREPARRRVQSALASRPLTLARMLARLSIAPRDGRVRVHVVAASRRDLEAPLLYRELPRMQPGVRVELAFVGPELDAGPDALPVSPDLAVTLLRSEYRRALWERLGEPDLIIGFDCGLLLYPGWKATVMDVLGRGKPFVVTTYRSFEQAAESKLLRAVGARPLTAPEPNPFASLSGRRSTTLVNDLSYDNAFVMTVT